MTEVHVREYTKRQRDRALSDHPDCGPRPQHLLGSERLAMGGKVIFMLPCSFCMENH
jgi:hypothetical protein